MSSKHGAYLNHRGKFYWSRFKVVRAWHEYRPSLKHRFIVKNW